MPPNMSAPRSRVSSIPTPALPARICSPTSAWLGPKDARSVLVTVSGTHGIEGYYGSGCQVGWFTEGHAAKLPANTAMMSIHASNPYGFSQGRRVNEDNMDINRNFIDFDAKQPPANPAYGEVHEWLVPHSWDNEIAAGIQKKSPTTMPASARKPRRQPSSAASTRIRTAFSMAASRPAGHIKRSRRSATSICRRPNISACWIITPALARSAIRK